MKRRVSLGLIAAAFAPAPALVSAQTTMPMPMGSAAKISPKPTAGEQPFVAKLQVEIPKLFSTLPAAQKAGYFRYTDEDSTGAISYVNLKVWDSIDLEVPNQLWYDVNGRLLGVDYTVLQAQAPKPPAKLFGYEIDPSRWVNRPAHMHYGVKMADGSVKFGGYPVQRFIDAGGDPNAQQADLPKNKAAMVKAGLAQTPDQVLFIFLHPAMWDLIVWVLPNPEGAFADANPNVKPARAKSAM